VIELDKYGKAEIDPRREFKKIFYEKWLGMNEQER